MSRRCVGFWAATWLVILSCSSGQAPPPVPAGQTPSNAAPASPSASTSTSTAGASSAPSRLAPASPEACKQAEKLRRSGFHKLLNLELDAAKADFQQVLRLDPGDIGALHQLDVIDAIEHNRQVGTSESNTNLRSQATPSRCAK